MMNKFAGVVFILFFGVFPFGISQDILFRDPVDDVVCETYNGVPGLCQRLSTCPEVMQDIKAGRKIKHCSFENRMPVVCCPFDIDLTEEKISNDPKIVNSPTVNFDCGFRNFQLRNSPRNAVPSPFFENDVIRVEAFVVGGKKAPRNSWPWMALLGRRQGPSTDYFCSGMVINENFVITAAHCVLDPRPFFVRLGEHDYTGNIPPETFEDIDVENVIFHPEYDIDRGYNDIALLKLNKTIRFKNEISPICLPWGTQMTENLVDERVTIAGWGIEGFDLFPSTVLQEVNVTVFHPSTCQDSYSTLRDFDKTFPQGLTVENIVCAGDVDGGKDACDGDSGGPMMHYNSNTDSYSLAGIISKGFGCGKVDFPGLYAPIRNYDNLLWIKNTAF